MAVHQGRRRMWLTIRLVDWQRQATVSDHPAEWNAIRENLFAFVTNISQPLIENSVVEYFWTTLKFSAKSYEQVHS